MQKIFVVAVQDQLFPFIPAAKLFVGSVIAKVSCERILH
jgi:hypothetical protein